MRPESAVFEEVRAFETLDLEGLRTVWSKHFGRPPKLRSVELLRLMLAWRMQAKVSGGFDVASRRLLDGRGPIEREGRKLGLGAILRRTWQGKTIEVIIEAKGFRHDATLYPSLSAIAYAVTGTRWNGPRFFGLRKEAKKA